MLFKKLNLNWWKITCILLLIYVVVAGFLLPVPRLHILNETIRNLYFHVPMWFVMVLLLGMSAYHSFKYLKTKRLDHDIYAAQLVYVSLFFGLMGLVSGMIWAKFTWGAYWSNDPKQNASAVAMLIYLGYGLLRRSFEDQGQRNIISAVFNIFAYAIFIPLIFILPRLTSSLHPGNGGNPAFSNYDLDSTMRLVFYPAVLGWFLLALWIVQILVRYHKLYSTASKL